MSEGNTFFAKPRVRFSQSTNTKENSEDMSQKKTAVKKNLPKIKNITSVKAPVKILSFKKQSDNAIDKNIPSIDDVEKKELVMPHENTWASSKKMNDCTLQDRLICKDDDEESLTNSHSIGNSKSISINQACKVGEKSSHKDISDIKFCPMLPMTTDNKDLCKALKPTNNIVTNMSKRSTKIELDKGKENKNSSMKKVPFLITDKKVANPLCLKTKYIKEKSYITEINMDQLNLKKHDIKSITKPCSFNIDKETKKTVGTYTKSPRKNSNKNFAETNVMPCHKYKKFLVKNKTVPVKKSIVHDIIVPNAKAYVESGIPKKLSDFDMHQVGRDINMVSNVRSSNKLSHPEFNSIICISKKLNEAKKEKIVMDIEHLPIAYKSLLNGKISSALDYPLNEIIYKNLIDLSINEKQFPCKIMRSRDPQPREKDIVPKLSDFFIPESTEEYYTSMSVKSRNSDIIESWNAFRISDKIREWKDDVDS